MPLHHIPRMKILKFYLYQNILYRKMHSCHDFFKLFVLLTLASFFFLPIPVVKTTSSCVGSEAACVLVFSAAPC